MRVQHRHIIYIQGYDPRGLAQYYRMFRTELRKFSRLYQLQATISRPKVADDEIASWTIDTTASDWQTRTAYDFLRFEDFIQQDLAAPIWRTVLSAVWIYWRLVFAGTIARFGKANWRFAKSTDAEEIVIVGHSSGSFLSTEMLARALKLDPALGRHGPRIVLLTIGGNFPIVGYHAVSKQFRDHLRQLAIEPSIDWIDCQARKDVMNFYQFDPITSHGIDVGALRRNPTIVPVRFRDIIRPEHYEKFRWQFFRVHFQFVMANELPNAYDFFMIVCGPVPLSERMAVPDAALEVATGDSAVRDRAWKSIEAATTAAASAADLSKLEPSARRSG